MERRNFLKVLFGGAAAVTAGTMLDPEKLLWVPGAKSFFIPDGKIAVRNIRVATAEETAKITGQHFLRIKCKVQKSDGRIVLNGRDFHHMLRVEEAFMVPEPFIEHQTFRMLEGATDIEVHFDNGSVAYGVKPTDTLGEMRAKAQANTKKQQARQAFIDTRKRVHQEWAMDEPTGIRMRYLKEYEIQKEGSWED